MSSTNTTKRRNNVEDSVEAPAKESSANLPETNAVAANSKSHGGSSEELSPLRQRKKKPPSQQQRMLLQMKAQQRLEKEQSQVVEAATGNAFADQLMKLLRTALLVLLIGGGILWYYSPNSINKWSRRKPELPPRSLISIYPAYVNIRRDLPRFFHEYSLATPDNLPARQAIRHVAADLKPMATNPGSTFQQVIRLWPWEVEQFRRQLPNNDVLDAYCGKGAEMVYQYQPELREEVVIWCLLAAGHDHGFVRFDVQKVYGSIARGIKGVAVMYDGHANRAMTRSLLLLPFHKPQDIKKGKPLPPSTRVAMNVMSWLRQNAPLIAGADELMVAMEEFLYFVISKEDPSAWHWLYAACTATERQARQNDPRVASMCTERQEEEAADCCVIYDPNLFEFYNRAKPQKRVVVPQEEKDE